LPRVATPGYNGSDIRKTTQYMDVVCVCLHCIAYGLNVVIQKSLNLWLAIKAMTNRTSCASLTTNNKPNDDEHIVCDDNADDSSESDDEDLVASDVQYIIVLTVKCRKLINTIRKSTILNYALLNLAWNSVPSN
jgi:hypothetical protein